MRRKIKSPRTIFFLSAICLVLLGVGFVAFLFGREMWVQSTLLPDIEARYGGLIVGEIHQVDADYEERITIVDIQTGSAFDLAGIMHNDVVVTNDSIGDFAKRLDVKPGKQVQLTLVPGGIGPPFSQRPSRTVTVTAP